MLIADLRIVAAVSGVYDALVGVLMLAGRPLLSQIFSVPLPVPPIHADLNGLFLFAVAAGYAIPYRDPESVGGRTYLWVMGAGLKGAGAVLFLLDYFVRHSPASFLIFAASDGTLALITLQALIRPRR